MQCLVFFFNDTAATEIYTYCHTLSLHDALPISSPVGTRRSLPPLPTICTTPWRKSMPPRFSVTSSLTRRPLAYISSSIARSRRPRSEEHTSELQSLMRNSYAVFCLKKKKQTLKEKISNTITLNTDLNKEQ